MPFKKPGGAVVTKTEEEEEEEEDYPLNGLSLSMPALAEVGSDDLTNSKGKHVGVASDDGTVVLSEGGSSSQTTQGKKQRRCWSHDLHQNFVKALFELGGAQGIQKFHCLLGFLFLFLLSLLELSYSYSSFIPTGVNTI